MGNDSERKLNVVSYTLWNVMMYFIIFDGLFKFSPIASISESVMSVVVGFIFVFAVLIFLSFSMMYLIMRDNEEGTDKFDALQRLYNRKIINKYFDLGVDSVLFITLTFTAHYWLALFMLISMVLSFYGKVYKKKYDEIFRMRYMDGN